MVTKVSHQAIEELLQNLSIREFIDLIPGNFFIKSKEGVFLETNQGVRRLGELDTEGKTDFDMPWKNEAAQLRENDKKVMDSKKQMIFTERLRSTDKEMVTFHTVKAPLFDENGNVIGIIGHALKMES